MSLIPEPIIDEIQARADIAELIGRYVPLKRAGRHYKGLCPFHKERTASFMVNTDKQIFHCFGCGVGGNVFGFLMQHDRLTFPEAVRQVADHVGVDVPSAPRGATNGHYAQLSALLEKICVYYERRLAHAAHGRGARHYLAQRAVPEATRGAFRLGLAPNGWQGLLRAAAATGISSALLEQAGLIVKGSSGYYDRFRNRLIFPIMDARRRVVGFGGRSLDQQEPKYLNSPETPLYQKGRHLFGLAQAKDAIVQRKAAVVVEGYFDCVTLVGAGVTHVVSPLGTAFTEEQVRLLRRYTQEVILAFDADAAGELATLRGIDLLIEGGCRVRVARLPAGVDPDEYVRASGREGLEQLLAEAQDVLEFLLEVAARRYALRRPEGKVQAAQFILPTVARVPNAVLRSEYLRILAQRLEVDETALVEELNKAQPRSLAAARVPAVPAASEPRQPAAEQWLVALILDEPVRWDAVRGELALDELTDPALRRVLAVVSEAAQGGRVQTAPVVSRLTAEGAGALASRLIELARTIPAKEQALRDCVRQIREKARRRRQEQLREQLQVAHAAGQERVVRELLVAIQQAEGGER